MRVVYIDSLFLLNFVVDYLLLLCAGRLAGETLRRRRLALGAAVGAAYAAAVFFPGMGFLLHPLCKLAAAVLALLAGYGGSRRLLRVSLCFFTAAAACGGGIFALELLGGRGLTLHNGVFYSAMDLRVILLSAAGCYVLITLVFHRAGRHSAAAAELAPVLLTLEGRKAALTALVDTGNTLTDPVDGRPVMVAEGERLSRLFPQGLAPDAQALRDPAQTMQRLAEHGWRRCRLLPYQAVGVECGLLLCVRVDGARVGGQDYGKLLVALSPNRLSDGGGYSALIGT